MAEDTPDLMNFEALEQEALRGVVRLSLERAASADGIPGDHHFYITFKTRGRGVSVPPDVVARYPDEMTIVLQHQYWDLTVEDALFSVMLKFGGVPKVLTVPYTAVTRFFDPSVNYLLQFDPPEAEAEPVADISPDPARLAIASVPVADDDPEAPKVVSLDQFRKK